MTKNHTRSLIIWWLIALTLVAGMGKLGFWQYGRAEEKRVQLAQVEQALRNPTPLSLMNPTFEPFERVQGEGRFESKPVILLDNQQRDGKVGVRAYGVFVPDELPQKRLLVDLGWLPMDGARNWPTTQVPQGRVTLRGLRVDPPSGGIARKGVVEKRGDQWLVVNLQPEMVAKELGVPVWPQVVRLDPSLPMGYERDLEILANTLTPEKHLGYAVQWWGLALTLLVIALVLTVRRGKR